jgi:hypothetical protein
MDVQMSIIDIIFMFFGALLIFAGLYLFVSGKKDTSSNHVEGFGIKLNVSNPSIILILSGIGLLVLPRFMPENDIKPTPERLDPQPYVEGDGLNIPPPVDDTKVTIEPSPIKVEQKAVYFPENNWQLNSYQENGVEFMVPVQLNATMTLSNRSATQTNWATNVFVLDMNGNIINNRYNGKISFINDAYTISFIGSTESIFQPEFNIPLELKIENGGILHMRFTSRSGEQIVHWQQ